MDHDALQHVAGIPLFAQISKAHAARAGELGHYSPFKLLMPAPVGKRTPSAGGAQRMPMRQLAVNYTIVEQLLFR